MIRLDTRDSQDVRIISIEGEVNCFDHEYLSYYMNKRIDSKKDVILNFSKLTYLDSTGYGNLVVMYKKQKDNNKRLALCQVNSEVYSLFEATQLTSILKIYESEDEAVRCLCSD